MSLQYSQPHKKQESIINRRHLFKLTDVQLIPEESFITKLESFPGSQVLLQSINCWFICCLRGGEATTHKADMRIRIRIHSVSWIRIQETTILEILAEI